MDSLIDQVRTKEFEMPYLRFGRGKKTLVILPGVSVQSVMGAAGQIVAAYALMAEVFTVYVFDRRVELPQGYTVKDMAEDTVRAFRALGLEEIYLFGASQGGMIALEIAIYHPALVKKLALGSTTACLGAALNPVLNEWIHLAQQKDKKGLYLSFGEKMYPAAVFAQVKKTLLAAADTVTDADLAHFIGLVLAMKGFSVTEQLGQIQCPVLLLGAKDDQVLAPALTEDLAKRLADKEDFAFFLYDGFGHAAFDTAPDYRERLYNFFRT